MRIAIVVVAVCALARPASAQDASADDLRARLVTLEAALDRHHDDEVALALLVPGAALLIGAFLVPGWVWTVGTWRGGASCEYCAELERYLPYGTALGAIGVTSIGFGVGFGFAWLSSSADLRAELGETRRALRGLERAPPPEASATLRLRF